MRKLKLQMQISIDGFVAGPNGEMETDCVFLPVAAPKAGDGRKFSLRYYCTQVGCGNKLMVQTANR